MDKLQQNTNAFVEAATAFNYKLLNAITEANNEDENVFVSPGRLQAVLVLMSNWVGRHMRERILEVICCSQMEPQEVNETFADERYVIPYCSKEDLEEGFVPIIDLNTVMWFQKGVRLDKRGLIDTEKPFHILFKAINFCAPSAMGKINSEVEKASHGLIKQLQIELTKETRALLIDVFYFKATWQNQFDEELTMTEDFYYKGGCSKVKMMSITDDFRYYENDILQSIRLEYHTHVHTRNYSMWIHLPKRDHTIREVLTQITEKKMGPKYKEKEVHLLLPRFEIETTTSLSQVLKMLGMDEMFASDDAIPNLLPNVRIDDIVQQGKITVHESGTEAAMVTYCPMTLGCPPDEIPKPIEMIVNHEFIFEIVETNTGNRLFSGIVNKL